MHKGYPIATFATEAFDDRFQFRLNVKPATLFPLLPNSQGTPSGSPPANLMERPRSNNKHNKNKNYPRPPARGSTSYSGACHARTCANNGVCLQHWITPACDCDLTSFTGPNCADGKAREDHHFGAPDAAATINVHRFFFSKYL